MDPQAKDGADCGPVKIKSEDELRQLKKMKKRVGNLTDLVAVFKSKPLNNIPEKSLPPPEQWKNEDVVNEEKPVTEPEAAENPPDNNEDAAEDSSTSSAVTCVQHGTTNAITNEPAEKQPDGKGSRGPVPKVPIFSVERELRFLDSIQSSSALEEKNDKEKSPEHLLALSARALREYERNNEVSLPEKITTTSCYESAINQFAPGYMRDGIDLDIYTPSTTATADFPVPRDYCRPAAKTSFPKEAEIKVHSSANKPRPSVGRRPPCRPLLALARQVRKSHDRNRRRKYRGLSITIIQEMGYHEQAKEDEHQARRLTRMDLRKLQMPETPTKVICYGTVSETFMCLFGFFCCFRYLVCW